MLKAVEDVSNLFISSVLSTIFGLIVTVFIARIFGPELYGTWQLLISLVWFVSIALSFGINSAILYLGSKKENKKEIISTGVLLKLTLSLFGYLIIFCLSGFFENIYAIENFSIYLNIIGFEIIGSALLTVFLYSLNALSNFKKNAILSISYDALRLILVLPLAILFSINGAIIGRITDWLIIVLIGFFFIRKNLSFKFNKKIVKEILKYGFPLYISLFSVMAMNRFPILYLGKFGSELVGLFSAAFLIVSSLYNISSSFNQVGIQRIASKKKSKDKKRIYTNLKKYVVIFASFVSFAIIPFSNQIINIIYGPEYSGAIFPLQIMLFAFFVGSISASASVFAYGTGKTKKIRNIVLFQSISSIIIGLFLIEYFGLLGAAITFLYSKIILTVLYSIFETKNKLYLSSKMVFKSLVAGLVMFSIINIVNNYFDMMWSIALGSIFGSLSFILSLIILKLVKKRDFDLLEEIGEAIGIDVAKYKIWNWFKSKAISKN